MVAGKSLFLLDHNFTTSIVDINHPPCGGFIYSMDVVL